MIYGLLVTGWTKDYRFSSLRKGCGLRKVLGGCGRRRKEDFLWSDGVPLEADTQTPLQTVERLFLHEGHKEAFGLEVLYADGIILDGTVYYRIDLGAALLPVIW